MGFGILFFACFLTYFGALTPIGAFTYVIGPAMMMYALYKLATQNKFFLISTVLSAMLTLDSMIAVIMYVFGNVNGVFYSVLLYIQAYMAPVLLITLLMAIYLISREVELRNIQAWSVVNTIFVFVYLICDIISLFVTAEVAIQRLGLVGIIVQVLYSAFMLLILFNCYARICYEDDKSMTNANTGVPVFDFLNKLFNKATDKNRKNKPDDKGDE